MEAFLWEAKHPLILQRQCHAFYGLAMQGILWLYVVLFCSQGDGHMMYMERNGGRAVSSKLMTPYKHTGGICIELYYWGHGNFSLIVEIRGEDFIPRLLVSRVRIGCRNQDSIPDSKVRGANMGPIWDRQDHGGPHGDPMNFAIWDGSWGLHGACRPQVRPMLAPRTLLSEFTYCSSFKSIIFKLSRENRNLVTCREIALRLMSQDLTINKSTSVLVMAWCCRAMDHYPNLWWPTFRQMTSLGDDELKKKTMNSRKLLLTESNVYKKALCANSWHMSFQIYLISLRYVMLSYHPRFQKWCCILFNQKISQRLAVA